MYNEITGKLESLKTDTSTQYLSAKVTEFDNIYFVGDGAGKAGNIVTAAATGLVAARDILKRVK